MITRIVRSVAALVMGLLFVNQVVAQNSAGAFMLMPNSAAAAGMGQAYTALSSDASATYWNPAGLAAVKKFSLVATSAQRLQYDRVWHSAALAFNVSALTIGANFTLSGTNDIEQFSEENVSEGLTNQSNMVIGLSGAMAISDELSVGGTVNYLSQDVITVKDKGTALDLGVRYKKEKIYFGACAKNVFGKLGDDDLPNILRLGVGMMDESGLMFGADYVVDDINNGDSRKYVNVGAGFNMKFGDQMSVIPKVGLQDGNFSTGLGVGYRAGSMRIVLDYGLVNETFGDNHRVGVTISVD